LSVLYEVPYSARVDVRQRGQFFLDESFQPATLYTDDPHAMKDGARKWRYRGTKQVVFLELLAVPDPSAG